MRFYTQTHKHYCGIDLHARTMYVCVLNQAGDVVLHRDLECDPKVFLAAIRPFREDLVVGVECIFTWYWLADLCAREGIAFVLGHALDMRAIHGAKAKNDQIDSRKLAALLRGQLMPQAYAYPAEMRATRDLMRRRLHFVRLRAQLLAHVQITYHQYNRESPGKRIAYASNRAGLGEGFEDTSVQESVAADLEPRRVEPDLDAMHITHGESHRTRLGIVGTDTRQRGAPAREPATPFEWDGMRERMCF
jgi:hypothetical protein